MNKYAQPLQGFDPRRLQRIDEVIARNYVETGAIPGALITIWRRGELVWRSTSGLIDIARGLPVREDSIFRLYSMTKPITAVALLMLMEEGQIALDDLVSRHIPGFADLGIYAGGSMGDFQTTPNPRPMKVVDLLRHTSGLTYGFLNRTEVDAAYRKLKINDFQTPGGLSGMINQLAGLPLEFSPGTQWNYSVSIDVMGYLVEKLSGMSFGEFLRTRLFEPLGMTDTAFWVPAEKMARFPVAHAINPADGLRVLFDRPGDDSRWARAPAIPSGAGGLVSTADDYMRFARMLLSGGRFGNERILSRKAIELMTTDFLTPAQRDMPFLGWDMWGPRGFGLGVSIIDRPGRQGGLGSIGRYGWGGAFGTAWSNDPKEDMAAIMMVQLLVGSATPAMETDFLNLVYQAIED